MRHSLEPLPRAVTRTLYVSPDTIRRSAAGAKTDLSVVSISTLLRAIVDHLCDTARPRNEIELKHLLAVVIDELPRQRELPLFVPALTSPLGQRVAAALAADPAGTPRIRDLAAELGVSDRTLERAFAADARMPIGEWRRRWRVCRAIALLANGMAVKDVALEVGYETPSAFVASFKRGVGMTPGQASPPSASR